MEPKKRIQWFNNLPDKIRHKAIADFCNYILDSKKEEKTLTDIFYSLEDCFEDSGFLNNHEHKFWQDIIEKHKDGTL